MTSDKLQKEAREAAEAAFPPGPGRLGGKLYAGKPAKEGFRERSWFQKGFIAAATAREKEVEELRRDKKLLTVDLDKLIVQNRKLFDAVNENQERIEKLQAAIRHANSSLLDYDDVEWETWNNMPGVRDTLEYGQ